MTKQLRFDLPTPNMVNLDPSRCNVRLIDYITSSRMIKEYHYLRRVPSVLISIGLFVDNILAGCITLGMPTNAKILRCCGEKHWKNVIELNRLFVFDWCGKNTESWFLGQTFKLLEKEHPKYCILVSYSDEKYGHLGTIYQATNWLYTGEGNYGSNIGDLWIDGTRYTTTYAYRIFGTRGIDKLRSMGHTVKAERRYPHHRYVYFLGSKRQRRALRKTLEWEVLPYPKQTLISNHHH